MAELIQGTMDDMAYARASDPVTSQLAAMSVHVREKQLLTLRALSALKRSNPQPVEAWRVRRKAQNMLARTDAFTRPMGESTIRTRLKELTRAGMVEEADKLGHTESGGNCTRYAITRMGLDTLKEIDDE